MNEDTGKQTGDILDEDGSGQHALAALRLLRNEIERIEAECRARLSGEHSEPRALVELDASWLTLSINVEFLSTFGVSVSSMNALLAALVGLRLGTPSPMLQPVRSKPGRPPEPPQKDVLKGGLVAIAEYRVQRDGCSFRAAAGWLADDLARRSKHTCRPKAKTITGWRAKFASGSRDKVDAAGKSAFDLLLQDLQAQRPDDTQLIIHIDAMLERFAAAGVV